MAWGRKKTHAPAWSQDDYHIEFAGKVRAQIEAGVAPWQKPWKPGEKHLPENAQNGKPYRGGNSLYLSVSQTARGYSDNRWATYKQIKEMGGQVRAGEKGTHVLFYKFDDERARKDGPRDEPGKTGNGEQREQSRPPLVRAYTVFNVEQAEGLKLERREDAEKEPEWKAHQSAELVIRESGVPVTHVRGDRAFYSLTNDRVTLPERDQFATANGYYQTALHELGHATGHESRLNRETMQKGVAAGFGTEEYAREELRAEISAMMTGERIGVGHDGSRGAAYVDSWLKALDKEPREIYRAAAEAQQISDHLIRPVRDREQATEKHHGELAEKYSAAHSPQISHAPKPPTAQQQREQERDAGMSR